MADFIHRSDTAFELQAGNFANYCAAHAAELNLTAGELAEIAAAKSAFEADRVAHRAAHNAAKAARMKKDRSRDTYEKLFRRYAARFHADPSVAELERRGMGLPPRDTVRSRINAPDEAPMLTIEAPWPLAHRIRFRGGGKRGGRPRHAIGLKLVRIVGDDKHEEHVGFYSRSPALVEYKPEDAHRTITYRGYWLTARGLTGPGSPVAYSSILG